MIAWPRIKDQIRTSLIRIADLDPKQVRWRDEAQGSAWVGDPSIWMRLTSVSSLGREEELPLDHGTDHGPARSGVTYFVDAFRVALVFSPSMPDTNWEFDYFSASADVTGAPANINIDWSTKTARGVELVSGGILDFASVTWTIAASPSGGTNDVTMLMSGQRHFTWSVRAESFEQDIASSKFAGNVIERIALRIYRWSEIWPRTAFAIMDRSPAARMEYSSDGRMVSCFVLDFHCATVDAEIDNTPGAGGYIADAEITGRVDDIPVAIPSSLLPVGSVGGPRSGVTYFVNAFSAVLAFSPPKADTNWEFTSFVVSPDSSGAIVTVEVDLTTKTTSGVVLTSGGVLDFVSVAWSIA